MLHPARDSRSNNVTPQNRQGIMSKEKLLKLYRMAEQLNQKLNCLLHILIIHHLGW